MERVPSVFEPRLYPFERARPTWRLGLPIVKLDELWVNSSSLSR